MHLQCGKIPFYWLNKPVTLVHLGERPRGPVPSFLSLIKNSQKEEKPPGQAKINRPSPPITQGRETIVTI